jgi:hypothetical protein
MQRLCAESDPTELVEEMKLIPDSLKATSKFPKPPRNVAPGSGPGFENTRLSLPVRHQKQMDKHYTEAEKNVILARQNFFSQTTLAKWTGEKGEYYVRSFNQCGQNSEMGHSWPQAWISTRSQTVNAAMWFKSSENDNFKLVSIWTFDTVADKNFQYYLVEYACDSWDFKDDIEEHFHHARGPIEHFSVGQDYWVTEFHCAPLGDVISAGEMTELENIQVNSVVEVPKGKRQKR